ncbi:MAG: DUF1501 domain-containing protein [Planctomycetia bacterium]|nr:DUF1501 domain-containing protein [Planctomycetia bacterium]
MLSLLGHPRSACDGVSRRELLRAGGAGLLGLSLPKLLAAEEKAPAPVGGRARSVIFVLLFGGPSQLETFDLKPEASEKIRGPFRPTPSRTSGLAICEHLPRLAAISDKFCVVRTMTHNYNDHSGGGHYIQTGRRWHVPIGGGFNATPQDWPSIGSVVEHVAQHSTGGGERDLPSYAVVPNRLGRIEQEGQYLRPGEYAGWLGRAYNPLTTTVDKRDAKDNPYWRDCTDAELTFEIEGLAPQLSLDRTLARVSLLAQFDAARRELDGRRQREYGRFRERALALVSSEPTRRALDIKREEPRLRDRYGRHLLGQSCLMARRLVEAGARFVTVHYDAVDGYSWDSHLHSDDVKNHLLPTFDQALSALLADLDQRGLLAETLVVALGEMGRTPQATDRWGRGHWSTLFPAVLAGGGVCGGTTYGRSDKDAAYPLDHPVSPEDLAATLYYALGIDPELRLPDAQGRPVQIVEGGRALCELFS